MILSIRTEATKGEVLRTFSLLSSFDYILHSSRMQYFRKREMNETRRILAFEEMESEFIFFESLEFEWVMCSNKFEN